MDWLGMPDTVLAELRRAGWSEDRHVDIALWIAELESQGYRLNEVAEDILVALGGPSIGPGELVGPNFRNDEPLTIDPIAAGSGHVELAQELTREMGGDWYPIGEWLSSSSVFVRSDGRMVATGLGWIWRLGNSVSEALELTVMAAHPLECVKTLDPRAGPWPSAASDGG